MAGPFHLLLLIMLVMTCTTAGQPTGLGASKGSKPKKKGDISTDDWANVRKAFLPPFTDSENAAKPRYGPRIVIESVDLLESPCAAPVLVAHRISGYSSLGFRGQSVVARQRRPPAKVSDKPHITKRV
jgi:hypothetical protein